MGTIRKIVVFVMIFTFPFVLVACFKAEDAHTLPDNKVTVENTPVTTNDAYDNSTPTSSARSVRVVAAGNEYRAFEHWNHGFDTELSASGWFKLAEDVANKLNPISFEDDFQIIIEGQLHGNQVYYYFYKLIDGEWVKTLAVYVSGNSEQIFLTHGGSWNYDTWEEVYAESFLDLLEPGEYILDIGAWWGDSQAANSYQNFFRLIK